MNTDFFAFGEVLWDCLPSGRHAGGAPFNVAAHLTQIGGSAALISAVGQDTLGDELLQVAADRGIDTRFVGRARPDLTTGTVQVTLDAQANATYEIVQPVAWDEIDVAAEVVSAVGTAQGLVFGSLASRSSHNRGQLDRLLDLTGPMKFFDVNLRPPFVELDRVLTLARRADVLKLNEDEVGTLAAWVKTGTPDKDTPRTPEAIAAACAVLANATGTSRLCVTRAAAGAALWDRGVLVCASAPATTVKDTVGAGDAFMAGLIVGLTRGADYMPVLESACRLGAYVASQEGATPRLPPELVQAFAHF